MGKMPTSFQFQPKAVGYQVGRCQQFKFMSLTAGRLAAYNIARRVVSADSFPAEQVQVHPPQQGDKGRP